MNEPLDSKKITPTQLAEIILKWHKDRCDDMQNIQNNSASDYEKGVILSNSHTNDINALILWVYQLTKLIESYNFQEIKEIIDR